MRQVTEEGGDEAPQRQKGGLWMEGRRSSQLQEYLVNTIMKVAKLNYNYKLSTSYLMCKYNVILKLLLSIVSGPIVKPAYNRSGNG